ncbi:MAG: DUF3883 domain-containing protein [Gemmatimonadota bacterium]|nr:DUF3883 domain-containing protein [Gemmatimonadota bacterium]
MLKPFILAIGLQRGIFDSVETFQIEWAAHSSSADALAGWIGSDEVADLIALAASNEDQERGALQLLEAARLDAAAWQTARELLGLPRHHFARSRRAYQEAQTIVVTTLMAAAAHAVSVDLGAARALLTSVQGLLPSAAVLDMPRTVPAMLHELLRSASQLLQGGTHGSLGVLLSRVDEGLLAGEAGVEDALRMRVTQREVDEYRIPEAARTMAAQRDLEIVLDAGKQLASRLGELLDMEGIAGVGRVAALAAGWWANRFAVLDALRQALEQIAPLTTRRLSEERAFRDPGPPGMLVGRIRELVDEKVRTQQVTAPAPRVIAVGGVSVVRTELDSDLVRGSDGLIGEMLRRHIVEPIDFAKARQPGPPPTRSGGRRGGGRSSRRDPQYWADRQDEREINGMLGEAFVYELFRDRLPGFDFQCWRSMNAVRYGTASEGDDTLGADFIYQDSSGLLTGRSDAPEVYLEVKATSEEGVAPFELSAGEWNTALRLHHEACARVHAIVRIEHVRDAPRLFRVYVDPVRLSHEGLLTIETADLRVLGG